jgi:hypothetical protein
MASSESSDPRQVEQGRAWTRRAKEKQHDTRGLRMLHTLGNLTLLTPRLNSSVSNGPFCNKRSAIAGQSRLIMNSYFQRFTDDYTWDEKAIGHRARSW